ncbi:MAG TPA: hypothetical protein VKR61_05570 [Bryobacteraceae bacterium]|nr:hypothetical protein [Bryobacteraceae bacterium]
MKLRGSIALELYFCLVAAAPAALATNPATLSANPPAVDFQYATNQPTPQPVVVTVTASNGSTPALTETVTPAQGTPAGLFNAAGNASTVQVGIDANTLNSLLAQPGIYSASIAISAAGFNTVTIPATISINSALAITPSATSLTFNTPSGATVDMFSLTGTSSSAVAFTVTAATVTGGTWLGVTTSANATPATLTATVTPGSLTEGTYTGSITVTPDSISGTVVIPVTLQVGASTLTANPASFAFLFTEGGTIPPPQTLQLTSTLSNNTYTAQANSSGNWLLVNGVTTNVSGALPATLNVTVNPIRLIPGNFQGTITVTDAHGATLSAAVTLLVTGLSNIANPTALMFVTQVNEPAPPGQTVAINGFGVASFTATVNQSWLSLSKTSGTAPSQTVVSVNPTGLSPGTYPGIVLISLSAAHIQNIQVTLVVSASAVLTTDSGDFIASYHGGDPPPNPLLLNVNTSTGAGQQFTYAPGIPSWLQINSASQPPATPDLLTISLAPQTLPTGTYEAQIVLLPANGGPTVTVPVLLEVADATAVVPSPTSLTFSATAGTGPQSQTVEVSASTTTSFTAAASTVSGGSWLSVSPASGTANFAFTPISVTADATLLGAGTYQGLITITTSGGVVSTVSVTFTVTSGSGSISLSPSTLAFAYTQNGGLPPAQTIQVTGTQSFTTSAATSSGGTWLAVTPASGINNATLTVSVNPTGVAPGTYAGTVTVTPTTGTAQTATVTLTVTATGTLAAAPNPLAFAYTAGNPPPAPQTVSVTSSGGAIAFAAAASSTGWLSVTPTSATTPATLTVSVNPANLGANTYSGSITLTGGAGVNAVNITVTLTVTAPHLVIDRVVNAASYVGGGISPGEIVTVFGTALGPNTGLGATIDSHGFIETSLGNVQVTFNGYAGPILYAGSGQVNTIVPYEVAGVSSASVEVIFGSARSNAVTIPVVQSAPGIFSANASGTGDGAILDLNYHLVSASNPAKAGDVIQIFATGQGQTNPPGVDGLVEPSVLPLPAILYPAGVTIGGMPATIQYIGAAPGLVAGALQVNVYVPAGVASGAAQLFLAIGGNSSQSGITVAVQ